MRITVSVRKPLEARWLWSILLGFGDGAEVLEPRGLRGILKERLRKALGYYEEA